jgi:hypothetical protein
MRFIIFVAIILAGLTGCGEDPHNGPFRQYCAQHDGTYIVQPDPQDDACVDQRR